MSDMIASESCCCGASIELRTYHAYATEQLVKFREAHGSCRERWGGTTDETTVTYSVDVDDDEERADDE